jgi:hypothetical protein
MSILTDLIDALTDKTANTHRNRAEDINQINEILRRLRDYAEELVTLTVVTDRLEEILTTKGDILYRNDTTVVRLAAGNENEVLRIGSSGEPEWWDMSAIQTSRDFWSDTQNTLTITGSSTTVTPGNTLVIPSGVNGIPSGATLDCVHILLKWRQTEDTSASDNAIANASMAVQIDDDSDTGWLTAYNFTNGDLVVDVDTSTISGGDMREGITDIKSRVDGADTYDIQIVNAQATGNNLILRDFQWGLRVFWH